MARRTLELLGGIRYRHPVRFILAGLAILAAVYAYLFFLFMRLFEGRVVGVLDALFWTVSRLTTTGESVPRLAYSAAPLQILSVAIQVSGLTFFFAAFPLAIIPAIERRLSGLPTTVPADLSDHVIIAGFSPLVESLIDELAAGPRPFLIVDEDAPAIRALFQAHVPCLYGDPSEEEVVRRAHADRAAFIIASKEEEEDNAKVILTAAAIDGQAKIIALIDDLERAKYFEYAGAHTVVSPKELLGTYLARKATTSLRDELFGANEVIEGLNLVEMPIYPGSPIDGKTLGEARIGAVTGASVVGIWHRGVLELEPRARSLVSAENVLMALGTRDQLIALQKLTRPETVDGRRPRQHFVIAGFGDVGRVVAEELRRQDIPFVIIDPREKPGEYIRGDATDERVLSAARLEQASTFIVASHIDRDNIFSTLLARKLNPDLHILARANHRETTDKLYRAGADFVFSLSAVAAQMLANMIVGDRLITLAEGLKVTALPVAGRLAGRGVGQLEVRRRTGGAIIALQSDTALVPNPGPDALLTPGGTIVLLGSRQQIESFKRIYKVS